MRHEYLALIFMTLFFMFAWVPVSLGKWKSFGRKWIASNRDPLQGKELLPWAARCERAHNNLKDYFPAFAVAIILLGLTERFDDTTIIAAYTFFICRLGHYLSYGLGNLPFRALFFIVSLVANIQLFTRLFI